MNPLTPVEEREGPSSSGLFGLASRPMGFGCRNSPLRFVIRPFSQDAGGFGVRCFFACLLVNEAHYDRIAGAIAHILNGRASARLHPPGLAPFRHCEDDLPKCLSGLRRLVFVAWRVGLIRSAGHQAFRRQFIQPVRQDVGGDAQRFHQFVKASQPQQQVAKYENAPAITKHGDRRRNWARRALIAFRLGARFVSARFSATAFTRWLPFRFPHGGSLATFVQQVDRAGGFMRWNLAK